MMCWLQSLTFMKSKASVGKVPNVGCLKESVDDTLTFPGTRVCSSLAVAWACQDENICWSIAIRRNLGCKWWCPRHQGYPAVQCRGPSADADDIRRSVRRPQSRRSLAARTSWLQKSQKHRRWRSGYINTIANELPVLKETRYSKLWMFQYPEIRENFLNTLNFIQIGVSDGPDIGMTKMLTAQILSCSHYRKTCHRTKVIAHKLQPIVWEANEVLLALDGAQKLESVGWDALVRVNITKNHFRDWRINLCFVLFSFYE